jgi:hypothetical protein
VALGEVDITGVGDRGGLKFVFPDLDAELEAVLGGEGYAHLVVLHTHAGRHGQMTAEHQFSARLAARRAHRIGSV